MAFTWTGVAPGEVPHVKSFVGLNNTKELFEHHSATEVTYTNPIAGGPNTPVTLALIGEMPQGLTWAQTNTDARFDITGNPVEMNSYVPEFQVPDPPLDTADTINGTYASVNSAAASYRDFPFQVEATAPDGATEIQDFFVRIVNNYSSDRDDLIESMTFPLFLDGVQVTSAQFVAGQKAKGFYPPE
ncbi:hypothetical protein GR11A_00123 [Vibrio phage vB_VcorM_GR11A]|nr:hypothetical protein GR11A_00123 [Vibrio phage vB_VcorM_GR11A]